MEITGCMKQNVVFLCKCAMAFKAFQNKVDVDYNILDISIGNRYWSYTNIMDSSYIHICQRLNMYIQVHISGIQKYKKEA